MSTDGADELLRAGYEWEIADAPLLHVPLTLADLAHVLELVRIQAIPEYSARILARELLATLIVPPGALPYSPEFGEMYSSRERYLSDRIADEVGWLRLGRTRREAMRTAYRVLVRRQLVDLVDAARALAGALCEQATQHLDTIMPDYTYLQPAEPTTFGHYLASFVDPTLRDAERLKREFADVNVSPMGSGAASGSMLLRERTVAGSDLGFDGPIDHVRDAMWQSDPFTHALLAATTLVIGQDKLAEDLEIFASREFAFVELGDALVRPSILMPQKRNPYALTVIRGMSGILIGRAMGQLSVAKSPSARSDLYIFAYGEVPRALELATRSTRLSEAVVRTLRVNVARMSEALAGLDTEATELATSLVRWFGVDYRTAHSIVSAAVKSAPVDAHHVTAAEVNAAAMAVAGLSIAVTDDQLLGLVDPATAVASHDGLGGSAADSMRSFIHERQARVRELSAWVRRTRDGLDAGEASVVQRARELADGRGGEGAP